MVLPKCAPFEVVEAEKVACWCRKGDDCSDVAVLAHAVLVLHAHKGCGPELLSVIGRLYTVVAEHAGVGPTTPGQPPHPPGVTK
jgi:hypothetical protein